MTFEPEFSSSPIRIRAVRLVTLVNERTAETDCLHTEATLADESRWERYNCISQGHAAERSMSESGPPSAALPKHMHRVKWRL